MKALYDLAAPAKLNLFLHITGRRDDGYHLLQSVFMLIDWYDTLHLEVTRDGHLTREDLGEPLPADDLVLRAARALQPRAAPGLGAHIAVHKRIPAQAGMGGGSSDAATCLLALNRLWALGLSLPELERIGLALGADVPFFLRGSNAWVEGIGERITPMVLPAARFLVVKPHAGLSTRDIFEAPQLRRDTPGVAPAILSGFAAGDAREVFSFGHNDLQPVARQLCPAVGEALDWLAGQGLPARMTGSGSAVFAHLPTPMPLADAPASWQVRQCTSLAVHPLAGWAAGQEDPATGSRRNARVAGVS